MGLSLDSPGTISGSEKYYCLTQLRTYLVLSRASEGSNGKPDTTTWHARDPEWCSPMDLPPRVILLLLGLLGLTEGCVLTALPGKVIPYPAGGYLLLKVTCRLASL